MNCKHGHSLDDAYTYTDDFGKKQRKCRECHKARMKRQRKKKKLLGNVTFDSDGRIIAGTI